MPFPHSVVCLCRDLKPYVKNILNQLIRKDKYMSGTVATDDCIEVVNRLVLDNRLLHPAVSEQTLALILSAVDEEFCDGRVAYATLVAGIVELGEAAD
jgi:hypothetical protein